MAGRRASGWTGGAAASLAAAVGLLVSARAIATLELPRPASLLGLPQLPREGLGLPWSSRAVWPADLQFSALDRLAAIVAAFFLASVAVAALNAVILLAEASAARRREIAVRAALGAGPLRVAGLLLGEVRNVLFAGFGFGLVLGGAGAAALRSLWPGTIPPGDSWLAASGAVAVGLSVLTLLVGMAHVGVGVLAGTGPSAAGTLRAGDRVSADPIGVFLRRAAPVVHTSVAGAVLVGALALGASVGDVTVPVGGARAVWVIDGIAPSPAAWPAMRTAALDVPGVEAESLASPGALIGLGVRDYVVAQCGPCVRGMLPMPLWGAVADHHSVGPDYFRLAGIEVLDGRVFDERDVPGAEPVAIVSATFARTSFHRGEPIGRKIRVGADPNSWYTVVGVVADARPPVVGQDELPREVLYLSQAQQPTRAGRLLVAGAETGALEVAERLAAAGFSPSEPRTLAESRAVAAAPLLWVRNAILALGLVALLLAAYGVHATALQVTRRRVGELAVRRALGATDGRVLLHVLGERVRVGLWGAAGMAFWGTLAMAGLVQATGIPVPGPAPYLGIAGLLLVVGVVAAVQAGAEAVAVEPASVVD